MSKHQHILIIEPCADITAIDKENIIIVGFTCPYCNGTGGFGYSDYSEKFRRADEPEWNPCPVCAGQKSIKADITICWTPDKQ